MGRGASHVEARLAASVGELEAVAPAFQGAQDVPNGGVLFALPALLAMGLRSATERFFALPKGSRAGQPVYVAGLYGAGAVKVDRIPTLLRPR